MEISDNVSTQWLVNQPQYSDPLVSVLAGKKHLKIFKFLVTDENQKKERLQSATKQRQQKQYRQHHRQQQQHQQQQQQYFQKQRPRHQQHQQSNSLENVQTTVVGGKLVLNITSKGWIMCSGISKSHIDL